MLSTTIKNEKNLELIRKYITYNIITYNDDYTEEELEYECFGYLLKNKSIKDLIINLYENKVLWNHEHFNKYKDKITQEDNFITVPFEVQEGIFQCNKCDSKRTISYQKQTRSADEGVTTFVQCVNCNTKWINNN